MNGYLEGRSESYFSSGQINFIGNFKDRKEDGVQEIFYRNGQLKSRNNLKDGIYDGLQVIYYENGQLQSKHKEKNGDWEGLFEEYYENGQLKHKQIYHPTGGFDGPRVGYWLNGQVKYLETWVEGNLSEIRRNYNYGGDLESIGFIKEGPWKSFHINSVNGETIKELGQHRDFNKVGLWKYFYQNGQLHKTGHYIDGKEDGPWIIYTDVFDWYETGNMKYGRKTGFWNRQTGGKLVGSEYEDGNSDGSRCYYLGEIDFNQRSC